MLDLTDSECHSLMPSGNPDAGRRGTGDGTPCGLSSNWCAAARRHGETARRGDPITRVPTHENPLAVSELGQPDNGTSVNGGGTYTCPDG